MPAFSSIQASLVFFLLCCAFGPWMKEGVSLQAQACHSGNLHHTVGWDLPQLEQIDKNLRENCTHLSWTLALGPAPPARFDAYIHPTLFNFLRELVVTSGLTEMWHEWVTGDVRWPHLSFPAVCLPFLLSFHSSLVFIISPLSTNTPPKKS